MSACVWNSQVLLLGAAVFANHAYYRIVHRVHDLLNFPAVRLPIIREVAVLMAHYSQVRPFVSTAISPAGPPGVKMATSWWARLTRWLGVKHPKARGRAGTIALPLRESLARRAGVPACLPACLPGLAWSANRSIPRSDYRGAADTEFYMRLLFRSLSPRPIGFSIFAPCYRGETIIYPHLPALFLLPHLSLFLS